MSQKDIMKKIWKYLRNYRIFIITSILLAVLVVALQLYIPILTGDAIDYIIDKGRVDFDGIFVVLKKMAVVIGITAICQWIMNVKKRK